MGVKILRNTHARQKTPARRPLRRLLLFGLTGAFAIVLAFVGFILLTERPAQKTIGDYAAGTPGIRIECLDDGTVCLDKGDEALRDGRGFIFYPGTQIRPEAYIPLLTPLAEAGIACRVPRFPLNMALFDENAALRIMDAEPDIERWYIGGHSMGALCAADCAAARPERFGGIVMIAGYTLKDLRPAGLPVLSVYGDADGVLNMKRYESGRDLLPPDFEEHVLPGANHAQYGDYGLQPRDKTAAISADSQQKMTSDILLNWFESHSAP